jgi:hypothetical protein
VEVRTGEVRRIPLLGTWVNKPYSQQIAGRLSHSPGTVLADAHGDPLAAKEHGGGGVGCRRPLAKRCRTFLKKISRIQKKISRIHSGFIAGVYHRGRESIEMNRTPKERKDSKAKHICV